MIISCEQMKEWDAKNEVQEWFLRQFPYGRAEYQKILNALAEDDLPDVANWLMNLAGPDRKAMLELDDVINHKHFFASGALVVKNGIKVTGHLRAGLSIKAGMDIIAGKSIRAATAINAGGNIKAGEGIKAGENINAGENIEAKENIKAGNAIKAGGGIKASKGIGAGHVIKAGLGIKAGWGEGTCKLHRRKT